MAGECRASAPRTHLGKWMPVLGRAQTCCFSRSNACSLTMRGNNAKCTACGHSIVKALSLQALDCIARARSMQSAPCARGPAISVQPPWHRIILHYAHRENASTGSVVPIYTLSTFFYTKTALLCSSLAVLCPIFWRRSLLTWLGPLVQQSSTPWRPAATAKPALQSGRWAAHMRDLWVLVCCCSRHRAAGHCRICCFLLLLPPTFEAWPCCCLLRGACYCSTSQTFPVSLWQLEQALTGSKRHCLLSEKSL